MAVFGAGFKNAVVTDGGINGGDAVATKTGTSPLQVWFKNAPDNVTWPADADAVQVGDIGTSTGKVFHARRDGKRALYVTNGLDKTFKSTDNGKTWAAI